jgi:hypothetical protein
MAASTVMRNSTNFVRLRGRKDPRVESREASCPFENRRAGCYGRSGGEPGESNVRYEPSDPRSASDRSSWPEASARRWGAAGGSRPAARPAGARNGDVSGRAVVSHFRISDKRWCILPPGLSGMQNGAPISHTNRGQSVVAAVLPFRSDQGGNALRPRWSSAATNSTWAAIHP